MIDKKTKQRLVNLIHYKFYNETLFKYLCIYNSTLCSIIWNAYNIESNTYLISTFD